MGFELMGFAAASAMPPYLRVGFGGELLMAGGLWVVGVPGLMGFGAASAMPPYLRVGFGGEWLMGFADG